MGCAYKNAEKHRTPIMTANTATMIIRRLRETLLLFIVIQYNKLICNLAAWRAQSRLDDHCERELARQVLGSRITRPLYPTMDLLPRVEWNFRPHPPVHGHVDNDCNKAQQRVTREKKFRDQQDYPAN